MNTKNVKTNEPYRLRLAWADKLNVKDPNKNMALPNLSNYYWWKKIKSAYNNNRFKISAPIGMMDHILFQTFKIVLTTLLNNMKP